MNPPLPPLPVNTPNPQADLPPLPPLPDAPLPPTEDAPLPPLPDAPLPPTENAPLPPLPDAPLPPTEDAPLPPLPDVPPPIPGQKQQLRWSIPAAVAILAAGSAASYCLHTETQALAEQSAHLEDHAAALQKDAATLSEGIALLRRQQDEEKENKQNKRLKENEENARLLKTLQEKEKEAELIRQECASARAEQLAVQKRINDLEKKLKEITSDKNGGAGWEPVGPDTVKPPEVNPPGPETDARLRQTARDYLSARKHGKAAELSGHFAPYCNYQYANNREVPNAAIMNNIRESWKKWPQRAYRILKVAYQDNHVEIIYLYRYANQKGRRAQGYARERWQTNSIGKIIHWREDLHPNTPPRESPGYRLAPSNINQSKQ